MGVQCASMTENGRTLSRCAGTASLRVPRGTRAQPYLFIHSPAMCDAHLWLFFALAPCSSSSDGGVWMVDGRLRRKSKEGG